MESLATGASEAATSSDVCQVYGQHPRTLVSACGSAIHLVDLRSPRGSAHRLFKNRFNYLCLGRGLSTCGGLAASPHLLTLLSRDGCQGSEIQVFDERCVFYSTLSLFGE